LGIEEDRVDEPTVFYGQAGPEGAGSINNGPVDDPLRQRQIKNAVVRAEDVDGFPSSDPKLNGLVSRNDRSFHAHQRVDFRESLDNGLEGEARHDGVALKQIDFVRGIAVFRRGLVVATQV